MTRAKRRFLDGEYGQIHVRVATCNNPQHPPLYCLHMSPKSGRSFENFMTLASNDRIVVAPDYPGYGESSRPPEDPPVRIEDYARSIWQVADALDHDRIDLVGFHTGSEVAVEVAHQRQDHVNQIVMISAPIFSKAELAELNVVYAPIPLDDDGTRFKVMWDRINEHRGPGMTLEMMAASMAENLRGGEAYEWGHRAAFAYAVQFPEMLNSLSHKISVLNPGDDLQVQTRRASDYLQNGQVVECPQWGHGFLDAHTEDAVRTVKKALD